MRANTVQRFDQHGHQVAIRKQQDQQAQHHCNDDRCAGGAGLVIDHDAGLIQHHASGFIEALGRDAKVAAQTRRNVIGLRTVGFRGALLRQLHLRVDALLQQRLPASDHLFRDFRIHRPWRNGFEVGKAFCHVIQRLLRGCHVRRSPRRFGLHHAAQPCHKAKVLIIALAQKRHLRHQLAVDFITVGNF